jgi:hypothetical protein
MKEECDLGDLRDDRDQRIPPPDMGKFVGQDHFALFG